MSAAVSVIRNRVIENLRDHDRTKAAYSIPEYDQAIKGQYQIMSARMPWPHVYSASLLTIAAGADTFTLATNFGGDVRIRVRSTGRYLDKVTVEQIDALRSGHLTAPQGASLPYCVAFWLDRGSAGTDLQGRCFPAARVAEACDVFYDKIPTELADGTLDAETLKLDTTALEAVILKTSSSLLKRLGKAKREELTLGTDVASEWDQDAERMIYRAAMEWHSVQAAGRMQRWVS